jgi:hypothetical protein
VHYHLQGDPATDDYYGSVSVDDIDYVRAEGLQRILAISRDSVSRGLPDGSITTCAQ